MNEYQQALTRIIDLEDENAELKQQIELDAIISGLMRDENDSLKSINAELLEALELLVGEDGDLFSDEAHSKARELIRKHKGE